ncbi:MAG: DUF3072 domain-containing protein [Pseudolabrys sp.]
MSVKADNENLMTPQHDDVAPMTAEQAALLKRLAGDAYEPEAFSPTLTRVEAQRRIVSLNAKLKLQDEPPHTL